MKTINIRIPESDTELFAVLLRRARTEAGMNQTEMAEQLGITQAQLSRFEAGLTAPQFTTLLNIFRELTSDKLEVVLAHLLNGHEVYAASIAVPPEVREHGSEKEAVEEGAVEEGPGEASDESLSTPRKADPA